MLASVECLQLDNCQAADLQSKGSSISALLHHLPVLIRNFFAFVKLLALYYSLEKETTALIQLAAALFMTLTMVSNKEAQIQRHTACPLSLQ